MPPRSSPTLIEGHFDTFEMEVVLRSTLTATSVYTFEHYSSSLKIVHPCTFSVRSYVSVPVPLSLSFSMLDFFFLLFIADRRLRYHVLPTDTLDTGRASLPQRSVDSVTYLDQPETTERVLTTANMYREGRTTNIHKH